MLLVLTKLHSHYVSKLISSNWIILFKWQSEQLVHSVTECTANEFTAIREKGNGSYYKGGSLDSRAVIGGTKLRTIQLIKLKHKQNFVVKFI